MVPGPALDTLTMGVENISGGAGGTWTSRRYWLVWFGSELCILGLVIAQPIDGHVILLDEHWYIKLGRVDHQVQVFDFMNVVKLMLDGWSHEGSEPPAG